MAHLNYNHYDFRSNRIPHRSFKSKIRSTTTTLPSTATNWESITTRLKPAPKQSEQAKQIESGTCYVTAVSETERQLLGPFLSDKNGRIEERAILHRFEKRITTGVRVFFLLNIFFEEFMAILLLPLDLYDDIKSFSCDSNKFDIGKIFRLRREHQN